MKLLKVKLLNKEILFRFVLFDLLSEVFRGRRFRVEWANITDCVSNFVQPRYAIDRTYLSF